MLGQLDRSFPGLTLVLRDVLSTQVGYLILAEFGDPARLAALGSARFRRFAAGRGLRVSRPMADRLVQAARDSLPVPDAAVARRMLAADLALLADLNVQINAAEVELARLVPASPFAPLMSVPGWGIVRTGTYGAALGDPARWPGHRQVYRASGLTPAQYESARKRREGSITREGSVLLRPSLIDLGIGLWPFGNTSRTYPAEPKAPGKPGWITACAMANRATRISYALVRDQDRYDPARWT